MNRSSDRAQFVRSAALPGVEALHATFVRHRYAPHVHDCLTVAYVAQGAATFELERMRYVAAAGQVFLIPPDTTHTGEAASPAGYTYHVLYLDPAWLAELAEFDQSTFRWRRSLTVLQSEPLKHSLAAVHAALVSGDALAQGQSLSVLAAQIGKLTTGREQRSSRPEHAAVRAARDYIRERWNDNFTLTDLAVTVGVSPAYLCRLFAEEIGMPPSAYRRSLRIEHARQLLLSSEPPARVAARCGFYDQAHLGRHFKNAIGITPARYAAS